MPTPRRVIPVWTLLALALPCAIAACGPRSPAVDEAKTAAEQPSNMITGTVLYRERIALVPSAELEIRLEDVSRQDAPATVIASKSIDNPGQVPIAFELHFNPAAIDERMTYAVRASVSDQGQLLFTTDTNYPVLTRGAGNHVDLMLVSARHVAGTPLEGMFRYMADAALFRDCRTNKSYPVAMEGAYIELERAYLDSGIKAGEQVHVRLTGRFLERPAMESNNKEIKLIVDSFDELDTQTECSPTANAELRDTYWKLVEIDGRPVKTAEKQREAHVILASDGSRAHGNGGCNNFFGSFESDGEELRFSALGSTMMACVQGMDTEKAFLEALGNTTRYRIVGQTLELYGGDQLLARLEAVYL